MLKTFLDFKSILDIRAFQNLENATGQCIAQGCTMIELTEHVSSI